MLNVDYESLLIYKNILLVTKIISISHKIINNKRNFVLVKTLLISKKINLY
jgi:hypothetical protein